MKRARVITFKIDGQDIGAHEDETILELARQNGIYIPTLCFLEGLSQYGGCRLCVVEVKGTDRLFPACTTYPIEGMEVFTDSDRLHGYRQDILQFLFSERNHVCSVCVSNGNCELQGLAFSTGMDHVEVPYLNPQLDVDASHPLFGLDHNRCVMCTRCVRVCDEIEGAHTWDVVGRGADARIVADLNQPWGEAASCTSCGKCVQVCPTGALFRKGASVAEMRKQATFLPYLSQMRAGWQNEEK
ncbi:MAG: bidirectional hydrogenase complex protein HoxU [Ardenticatenaceae bacterium]|nr:bidirectional hydrogenase complex protein HoxU [Ardenticatenaceae bacterium]